MTRINPDLEALFHKYESAPDSYVFAPLADAYRKAGMLEEAVEICRKGLRKHPEYPSGHVVEGKCHFDVGELDGAESSFQKVLELDQSNLVALKYLGMIQAGRGRLDKAGEYFKHILDLDPDNREIKGMLEDLSEVERRPKGGGAAGPMGGAAEAAADARPGDSSDDPDFEGEPIRLGADDEMSDELATTTLADIYAAQGYHNKAARIYREVLRSQPGNDDVRSKLDALDCEGEVGDTEPPPAVAREARAEATELRKEPVVPEEEDEDITLEATVGEIVTDDPLETARPAKRPARAESGTAGPDLGDAGADGRELDEKKSYDQFKRWLDNMNK